MLENLQEGMSLQKLIEERSKLFDEKFPDITHVGCDTRLPCGDMKMDIKQFHSETINLILAGVVEMVGQLKPGEDDAFEFGNIVAETYTEKRVALEVLDEVISQLQTLKK